ncbi:MAG: hypothetical protein ACLT3Y_02115 [Ruminococcus callidus]
MRPVFVLICATSFGSNTSFSISRMIL